MKKRNKKSQIVIFSIIIVIIIGIFVYCKFIETQKFNTATTYILNEHYEEAKNILNTITESDKRNSLISLCDAHIKFNSGNISGAYRQIDEIKNAFDKTFLGENVNNFYAIVEKEYNNYLAEQKAKQEQADKEAKEKRAQSPPYVGMAESYINDTSWGTPDKSEKCVDYNLLDYNHKWVKYYWYNIDSETSFAVATVYYNKDGKQSEGFIYWLSIYSATNPRNNQHLQYGK